MTGATDLKSRYVEVRQRIVEAARRAGRSPDSVHLVAVTKYAAIDQIRELVQLGHRDLGENHIQNLIQRAAVVDEWAARSRALPSSLPSAGLPDLARNPIRWHLIGPVQTNKARKAVELSRLIHTCDNLRVAEALQDECVDRDEPCEILVQINASGEESKSGVPLPAVPYLIETIEGMTGLRCRGLMTMAPHDADADRTRMVFARCRDVFEDIRTQGIAGGHFDILSMGMSGDYELAIEQGANIVRVGSAIFGSPLEHADSDTGTPAPETPGASDETGGTGDAPRPS